MSLPIALVLDDSLDDLRSASVRAYTRRALAAGLFTEPAARDGAEADLLRELVAQPCRLIPVNEGDFVRVLYVAPAGLRRAVATRAEQSGWDARILKKQRAAFRQSVGALIRLPLEGGDGHIAAFITDWSPFPAAAAVAVHPAHPCASVAAGFAGRFVRNPLTGDLLPVWVADWVKPEFGTGAVIVNPGHDGTDLAYARKVGLPVRFALEIPGDESASGPCPVPPVIRQGISTRSGVADGLPPDQARAAYFALLQSRGAAEACTDYSLPPTAVATLNTGSAPQTATTSLASLEHFIDNQNAAPAPLLRAVAALQSAPSDVCVITNASTIDQLLLNVRILSEDLRNEPLRIGRVIAVQKIADSPHMNADRSVIELAALIAGPLDQPGNIRPQTVEQAAAFIRGDEEMLRTIPIESCDPSSEIPHEIRAAVEQWDLIRLFQLVYGAQKKLRARADNSPQNIELYRVGRLLLTKTEEPGI